LLVGGEQKAILTINKKLFQQIAWGGGGLSVEAWLFFFFWLKTLFAHPSLTRLTFTQTVGGGVCWGGGKKSWF